MGNAHVHPGGVGILLPVGVAYPGLFHQLSPLGGSHIVGNGGPERGVLVPEHIVGFGAEPLLQTVLFELLPEAVQPVLLRGKAVAVGTVPGCDLPGILLSEKGAGPHAEVLLDDAASWHPGLCQGGDGGNLPVMGLAPVFQSLQNGLLGPLGHQIPFGQLLEPMYGLGYFLRLFLFLQGADCHVHGGFDGNGHRNKPPCPISTTLLRWDDNGEIYDIVAGTFLVTGLTDDSFGSLSPDLLRQFVTEFKMPEQFAKIGDRIVAIPMISEEQQKQTVLEEKSSIVNENTSGMAVDGHIGTWHTIDHKEIDGHTFWLMEHDTFGDDASCIIVDERGELVLSHIYDGFDETAVNLLRQEVMPVEKMPDDSISIEDMKQYGYKWGGMLPMREDAAAEVMKSCQIYRLYGDDTEGLVLDANEIKEHAAKGGIFGVEKADWVAELEKQNPLKAAEMSLEDDYGMIDGIINNGPKEDKTSEKGGKVSIMDRLKSAKTAQQTDKPSPHKEKKSEREL